MHPNDYDDEKKCRNQLDDEESEACLEWVAMAVTLIILLLALISTTQKHEQNK